MKRLFLTSIGLGAFPSFVGNKPNSITVGFIPTAADPYEDKWFMEEARQILTKQGFKLINIDIKDKAQLNQLNDVDVIFVSGGNTFYLLEKAIESGALGIIKELVNKEKIYAGGSAGATFAGPTIEPVSLLDDPQEAPNLKTYNSLGLTDFVVIPHSGKEKYAEKHQETMKKYMNNKYKLIPLTDSQAVVVNGDSFKVIDTD
jgi:dipeptidase E